MALVTLTTLTHSDDIADAAGYTDGDDGVSQGVSDADKEQHAADGDGSTYANDGDNKCNAAVAGDGGSDSDGAGDVHGADAMPSIMTGRC